MNNKTLKNSLVTYIIVVTYGIILFLTLTNFDMLYSRILTVASYISPFFTAMAIAFIFNIPVKFIEEKLLSKTPLKLGVKRAVSISTTILLFFTFTTALITFIFPQIRDSVSTLTSSVQGYINSANGMDMLYNLNIPTEIVTIIESQLEKIIIFTTTLISNIIPYTINLIMQIISGAFNLIMSFIISIYILASKENLARGFKKLLYAICNKKIADGIVNIANLANVTFSGFIGGQLTEAVILGALTTIGMLILGLEYALLIGTIIGVTSVIPMFGAFIGATPGVIILMMISPSKAVIFVVFIILLQQFEGNLIYPRVVGSSIGISGLWILFAMLLGGGLGGVVGILLGIPSFAVIYILTRNFANYILEKKNISIPEMNEEITEIISEDIGEVE
ncbi:MAG: AI-2E family transporter [Clostridia bacterium]